MKKIYLLTSLVIFAFNTISMAQSCPNGDFESWKAFPYDTPDSGWFTSDPKSLSVADSLTVWKVAGQSGQAIHIQTAIVGTDTLQAYATNSLGDPTQGMGGVPYSQQPTAITGYYRYNIATNDSAILFVVFKKNGAIISQDLFKIGGSQATFTTFSFPLSLAAMPDTVILGATSSNLFGSGLQSGSWLELDQLAFSGTGITQAIPDGNFDTWLAQAFNMPAGWNSQVDFASNGITKITSGAYSGDYAVQLVTVPSDGGGGGNQLNVTQMTTAIPSQNGQGNAGLPYTHTTDTLTGYYQYAPSGTDSAFISVNLQNNGNPVGGNALALPAASSWTYFELPIMAGSAPDSMRIDVYSSVYPMTTTTPGSTLKLDYLQLKSQPLPPVAVNKLAPQQNGLVAYPNPATDVLNMKFDRNLQGPVSIKIYDIIGRVIENRNYGSCPSTISFNISQLRAGLYFYEVQNKSMSIQNKFIKQ